jgi:hypothetical protein
MVKDRSKSDTNKTDQQYIQQQMKAIKKAKKSGDEARAQRIADDLMVWLGWDQ